MSKILGRPEDIKKFTPDPRWVLPNCLIGMEFEYENARKPLYTAGSALASYWDVHRDESLKDNGIEYVFKTPLFGVDAYLAIEGLMISARATDYRCSRRAGIHVHLDVRDMEAQQWVGMTILYTLVEPILFRWIGDNRDESIFCVPFYKADESLGESCSLVRAALDDSEKGSSSMLGVAKNFNRYAAFNLQALAKFGSVEYRHMRSTHDIDRVVNWINMIMSLKAAVYRLPTSDGVILRMAQEMDPYGFLEFVFGPRLAQLLWSPEVPILFKSIGIPTAKDLVLHGLSFEEWEDELYIPAGRHMGFAKWINEHPVPASKQGVQQGIGQPAQRGLFVGRNAIDEQQRARDRILERARRVALEDQAQRRLDMGANLEGFFEPVPPAPPREAGNIENFFNDINEDPERIR